MMGFAAMVLHPSPEQLKRNKRLLKALNAALAGRTRELPKEQESGDLVILDDFQRTNPYAPTHGELIHATVQQQRFHGKIYDREDCGADFSRIVDGTSKGDFLKALRNGVSNYEATLLAGEARDLRKLGGLHDGAVNLSTGCSKANIVAGLYQMALDDDAPRTLLSDYGKAFGFNPDQLVSSSKARGALQQGLIDQVNRAVEESPSVKRARASYLKVVSELSDRHVSVVVAGENQGTDEAHYARDSAGRKLRLPGDFYVNPLTGGDTVVVGALADYNSPVKDDVLASGLSARVDETQETGTSFATPRVGAALAQIHGEHPGLSNADALAVLQRYSK